MEIEFRYGVLDGAMSIPSEDASDINSCRSSLALDVPCDDARVLKDSSHSSVSSGSVSGRVCRGSGGHGNHCPVGQNHQPRRVF